MGLGFYHPRRHLLKRHGWKNGARNRNQKRWLGRRGWWQLTRRDCLSCGCRAPACRRLNHQVLSRTQNPMPGSEPSPSPEPLAWEEWTAGMSCVCGTRQSPHRRPSTPRERLLSRGAAWRAPRLPLWVPRLGGGMWGSVQEPQHWASRTLPGCAGGYLRPALSSATHPAAPEALSSGPKETRDQKPRAKLQGRRTGPVTQEDGKKQDEM